jgi:hypothetical protein
MNNEDKCEQQPEQTTRRVYSVPRVLDSETIVQDVLASDVEAGELPENC